MLHHSNKVTDLKPFMAALWPELLAGAAWWAWGDIDVLWGDLPRYLALAPPRGSFVCPLLPNPWGAATWGPFTAWRIAHNTTELFREWMNETSKILCHDILATLHNHNSDHHFPDESIATVTI